jgi:hypothetical protein
MQYQIQRLCRYEDSHDRLKVLGREQSALFEVLTSSTTCDARQGIFSLFHRERKMMVMITKGEQINYTFPLSKMAEIYKDAENCTQNFQIKYVQKET